MAREVILVAPSKRTAWRSPPLGLGYIASVLREAGFPVSIIDVPRTGVTLAELAQQICARRPLFVGLTVMTATYPHAVELTRHIKSLERVPVILGGPHATYRYREILEAEPAVDGIVRFEGEWSALALARALHEGTSLERVPNLAWRANGQIVLNPGEPWVPSLDALPPPARDLLDLDHYPEIGRGTIFTSRGCPYNCIFCCSRSYNGPRIRTHSLDRTLDEVKEMVHRYGIELIEFQDDFFTFDKKRLLALCQRLQSENLGIRWGCQGRIDSVDAEMLSRMAEAGCVYIYYGTESGDQEILDKMRKRIDASRFRQVVDWTHEAGIEVQTSLMVAFPWDTEESLQRSITTMRQVEPDSLAVDFVTPFPGSDLGDHPEAFGVRIVETDMTLFDCNHPVIETPHLSLDQMRTWYLKAMGINWELDRIARERGRIRGYAAAEREGEAAHD